MDTTNIVSVVANGQWREDNSIDAKLSPSCDKVIQDKRLYQFNVLGRAHTPMGAIYIVSIDTIAL